MALILPFPQEEPCPIPAELAAEMKAQLSWLPELAALLQEEGLQVSEQDLLRLALSLCVFVPAGDQEQAGTVQPGKES